MAQLPSSTSPAVALARRASEALADGDRRGLRKAVTALLAVESGMGRGWRSLAEPLLDWGELSLARAAIDRYVAWANRSQAALFDQAAIYARSAQPAEAATIMATLPATVPDRASYAYLRGTLALNLGDLDTARGFLIDALIAHPLSGQAAHALATVASMVSDDDAAERILAALPRLEAAAQAEQPLLHYAIAKVHADRGEIDTAFAHYAAGAALLTRARRYDETLDRAGATRAVQGWDADAIAMVAERITIPTDRPIIVTGLPRSGTTLVEQILVSHSAVVDGDEVGRFRLIVDDMGGSEAAAARWLAQRSRPDIAAGEYLRLLAERFPSAGRVVDKTLEASRYMGTLASLLPDAPILWIRRDPLARAWSCYSTYFMSGLAWSFDLVAIARHFRLEDELLARWQEILGDRIRVVDYERLVTDKTTVIPDLLAHCGLAPEPATLTPERTPRLVRTASVAQVREPIGARRVDAAEAYRRHLQPFIDAYGYAG